MESVSYSLDSHELRCLSVLKPMSFLMAVEYDIFLAATQAGRAQVEVHFPLMPSELRRALCMCAARFHLSVREDHGNLVAFGLAEIPLLRYVDFLPGGLHFDEVLSVTRTTLRKIAPEKHVPFSGSAKSNSFVCAASAVDYAALAAEDPKFEAVSFFLTIDAGLPLATMGHLIRFEIPLATTSSSDAVKSFQRFSHWTSFDLRWDNEDAKRSGVIVFPSTADAHDIFERYEDEDTSDDAALLFRIRPIGACTHVPYLEDALLRRIRDQMWDTVVAMWSASPHAVKGVPAIVVYGFHPSTPFDDLMDLLDWSSVSSAVLVVEDNPSKRRRLYVQVDNPSAAYTLLSLDGQRALQLPSKPNLRAQVAPPFFAETRRGHVLSARGVSRSPSPQQDINAPEYTKVQHQAPQTQRQTKANSAKRDPSKASTSPSLASTKAATTSPSTTPQAKPKDPVATPNHAPCNGDHTVSSATPHLDVGHDHADNDTLGTGSKLNRAAVPFIPTGSPSIGVAMPPPPPYAAVSPGATGLPPPPYTPPPPTYMQTTASHPPGPCITPSPIPFLPPPPAYTAAPPPPPYTKTPGVRPSESPAVAGRAVSPLHASPGSAIAVTKGHTQPV